MNTCELCTILSSMNEKIRAEKEFLTDLDNAIADGDHGINMAKGFSAVAEKLPQLCETDIGTLFKTVGMTLVSAVGGSSGPLYGTVFMKAGMLMAGKEEMDVGDLIACLKAGVEGVMMRGRAVQGEKTMLDAMIPALEAMEHAKETGMSPGEILAAGVCAAEKGVEFTKTIAATKGRASYIGERSIGHQDPGATSFTMLLDVVAQAVR